MISSNIYKNGKRIFKPSTIIKRNGVRYGLVGVTTPETKIKTSPDAVKDVEFKDPLSSVKVLLKKWMVKQMYMLFYLILASIKILKRMAWRLSN